MLHNILEISYSDVFYYNTVPIKLYRNYGILNYESSNDFNCTKIYPDDILQGFHIDFIDEKYNRSFSHLSNYSKLDKIKYNGKLFEVNCEADIFIINDLIQTELLLKKV